MNPTVISHFKSDSIKESDGSHVAYRIRIKDGLCTSTVYPVLPGLEVILMCIEAERYWPIFHKEENVLTISYCVEGRAVWRMGDGLMQYASEGDLMINSLHYHSGIVELPTGQYRGLMFMIDVDVFTQVTIEQLPFMKICLKEVVAKFPTDNESYIIRSRDELQRMLSDVCSIPAQSRSDYLMLKALELFIYLNLFDTVAEKSWRHRNCQQVDIIKQIHRKLTASPDRRFSIDELAREYSISATTLKKHFKCVYGKPISIYMKEYRVRRATEMLRKTDLSIAEITRLVGYESQSNFGRLFKELTGETPLEYRERGGC